MKFPIEGFQGEATRTVNAYLALSFDATFSYILPPCACVLLEKYSQSCLLGTRTEQENNEKGYW